jgi:hypothetical protein
MLLPTTAMGMPGPFSDFIVFVDESGDHSLASIHTDYPVFVLAFCILPAAAYVHQTTPGVRGLKFGLFGHDLVILHEHDIRKRTGVFSHLGKDARAALQAGLTDLIRATPMRLIAVVIDKVRHREKYPNPGHPYHVALTYGLAQVHRFLQMQGQGSRRTTVVCEARGRREDKEMELAFRRVCDGENPELRSYALDIVIADKRTNAEGLQLADLAARPIGLHILRPLQSNRAWDVLAEKFVTSRLGTIEGSGLTVLP